MLEAQDREIVKRRYLSSGSFVSAVAYTSSVRLDGLLMIWIPSGIFHVFLCQEDVAITPPDLR